MGFFNIRIGVVSQGGVPSIVDYDGNIYTEIVIGTQTWLIEPLKTTHFNDGTEITVLEAVDWSSVGELEIGCGYPNADINNKEDFGMLYKGGVAIDARNAAPNGYHVASKDDFDALGVYIGGYVGGSAKLREIGTDHWTLATGLDSYGFRARGAGILNSSGLPESFLINNTILTSTIVEVYFDRVYKFINVQSGANLIMSSTTGLNKYGCTIRCLKD